MITISTTITAISTLIAFISAAFAIYMGLRNARHADESDAERKAKESAEINVKLDQIGNDVRDIKYDIAAVKRDVQGLTERVVIVEQSTKSAHHRIDQIIVKGDGI